MKERVRLRALGHIRWGDDLIEVFPLRVLYWFSIVFVAICLFVVAFDRTLETAQEGGMLYQSLDWDDEDKRILDNIFARVLCDPVIRLKHWKKPPVKKSGLRLLVVGDSYIFGDGLSNYNDTYWMQLRRLLREKGYEDIEVIAIGECGWSTSEEFKSLRCVAPDYEPDIVIWAYVTNDPDEKAYKQAENEEAWAHYHSSLIKNDFWYERCNDLGNWLPRLGAVLCKHRHEALIARTPPPPSLGYQYCSWLYILHSPENLNRYENTLDKIVAFIDEYKAPHFFVGLTKNHLRDDRFFVSQVSKIFSRKGIPFYDLGPGLEQYHLQHSGRLPTFDANPSNGHPNCFATRTYAELTLTILEEQYPQFLPPKRQFHEQISINDWVPYNLDVQENDGATFSFNYPSPSNPYVLRMPFNRPYVQLNFEYPIELSSIVLRGKAIKNAQLDYTAESLNDQRVYQLGDKRGYEQEWKFEKEKRRVRTIRMSATFAENSNDRKIELLFHRRDVKGAKP